jgi:hypothetical protein
LLSLDRKWAFVMAAILAAAPLRAGFSLPVAELEVRAGNDSLWGQKADNAFGGHVALAPRLDLGEDDSLTVIGLLESSDREKRIPDDGFFVDQALAAVEPGWRHHFGGTWSGQLRGRALRQARRGLPGDAWLTNAYDFEDYSVGVGIRRRGSADLDLGVDLGHRGYPNWRAAPALPNGRGTADKDYNKLALELRAAWHPGALTPTLALGTEQRIYNDAFQVRTDGTVDDQRLRSDAVYTVEAGLERGGVLGGSLRVALDGGVLQSNAGYYDAGRGRYVTSLDAATGFGASLDYRHALGPSADGNAWGLGYAFHERRFCGLPARDEAGAWLDEKRVDREHAVNLDLRLRLTPHLSALGAASVRACQSNDALDLAPRSAYSLAKASLGLELSK